LVTRREQAQANWLVAAAVTAAGPAWKAEVVIAGVPSDNTTLLEILDELAAKGYGGSMWVTENGKLRCEGCNTEFEPSEVYVRELRRLECASDPDDMLAIVAVECAACSMKGTVVLHFGPEASAEEMEALTHFQRLAPPL
jgi:hypothetical protein